MTQEHVAVTREEAIELLEALGLPTGGTNEELVREIHKAAARIGAAKEAEKVAAAEARERAEDKRIVAAAVADARIPESRKQFWIDALGRNRDANRDVVASLTPIPAFMRPITTQRQAGVPTPPQSVAASGDPFADGRERAVLDSLGLPVADMPAPVLMRKGVNVEDYTQEQHFDRFMNMLGGKFKASARPLPQGDSWYLPSPNDTVEFKNGQWVPKNPYKEVD
jgi:hypothetical protein